MTYILPGTSRVLLGQISFCVEPGEVAAVIGPSGVGKSTLCRILTGLTQPTSGHVRLDGSDIRNWDQQQLGRYVGYLPQVVELFDGTVRENIARMMSAADEDVLEAAIAANAHEVIQELPTGYDTRLGIDGLQLSGGQRQRVGLARAVFGRPKLVILDEPNANLDQAGEVALVQAIENLKRNGSTVIIVGHRPSTLAHADKLLVIQSSKSSMFGSRDDVLRVMTEQQEKERANANQKPERTDFRNLTPAAPSCPTPVPPSTPAELGANGAA